MQPAGTTLQRYFAGKAEYVFGTRLGVVDPPLVDYLSDLLVRFARMDVVHKVRDLSGQRMMDVAEMLEEANNRIGLARRNVHQHIGDFTLFWAGVYPEALQEMQSESKKDHFINYCRHGKLAYGIASTLEIDDDDRHPSVFHRLSDRFAMCAYGLREVRREWERRDDDSIRLVFPD